MASSHLAGCLQKALATLCGSPKYYEDDILGAPRPLTRLGQRALSGGCRASAGLGPPGVERVRTQVAADRRVAHRLFRVVGFSSNRPALRVALQGVLPA